MFTMPLLVAQQYNNKQQQQRSKPAFISCTRCRERKIKCSGERPACVNCQKKSFHCHYDAVVKRRGPDKEPGGRLKPRGSFVQHIPPGNGTWTRQDVGSQPTVTFTNGRVQVSAPLLRSPGDVSRARDSWWQSLFASTPRDSVVEMCRVFVTDCHIWFNFFHQGLFFKSFFAQELGAHVVFGIMAHMTFLREGNTKTGQLRALHFAEEARRMVDYCLAANSLDPTLAQTALLLVAFEFQPHMHQNLARATAALGFMEACAKTCLQYWYASTTATDISVPATSIRREEMRQMCWTLSHLAANCTIWRHLVGQPPLCLFSADPFSELFPSNLFDADNKQPKLHSWSLYCSAIRLWHTALNRVPEVYSAAYISEQAQNLLPAMDIAPCSGSRRYLWQAREWVTAARGYVGGLDTDGVRSWFKQQKDALVGFEAPESAGEGAKSARPTYAWWYLMVAYMSLQLSSQYPYIGDEAQSVLDLVLKSLDRIIVAWPCATLEHLCQAVRKRNHELKTVRAQSSSII